MRALFMPPWSVQASPLLPQAALPPRYSMLAHADAVYILLRGFTFCAVLSYPGQELGKQAAGRYKH